MIKRTLTESESRIIRAKASQIAANFVKTNDFIRPDDKPMAVSRIDTLLRLAIAETLLERSSIIEGSPSLSEGQRLRVVFINNFKAEGGDTVENLMRRITEGELVFAGGPEIYQIQDENGIILREETF